MKQSAIIHSLKKVREMEIVEKTSDNQYVDKYQGTYATAIFNPFVELYYVDGIYERLENYARA